MPNTDIPSDKLEAALDHLESVKSGRLQARVAAGEVVVQTITVVCERDEDVEAACKRALANLPALDPDGRPIHPSILAIVTGVPRDPDFGKWVPPVQTASAEGAPPSAEPARGGEVTPSPPPEPIPTHVAVTVHNGDEDDPGQIAEGWYTIEDDQLVLRDRDKKFITSRCLLKGENPRILAKILLRERAPNEFQLPIRYKPLGIA